MSTIITNGHNPTPARDEPVDVELVPAAPDTRRRIRAAAQHLVADLDRRRPPARDVLERVGRDLLASLRLDDAFLGFAMVAANSAFWRDQFAAVPFARRLLLLPHCLRNQAACKGRYDEVGLHCGGCGSCVLPVLTREAETLGYTVLIAEGTPAVVQIVLGGRSDAVLGVACLDSLDKAFGRISEMGVPNIAVPLFRDGCVDTEAELDVLREWLHCHTDPDQARTRSFLPLLRAAEELFEEESLSGILDGPLTGADGNGGGAPGTGSTMALSVDWLRAGGKRFRPFIVLAGYAVIAHGADALDANVDASKFIAPAARRLAVAIEALHKASLIHDDIEDDDAYRYGRETLHRSHGLGAALNAGDYLVGLGYRLLAVAGDEFSAECVTDVLAQVANAHLELCRGQGAELMLTGVPASRATAADIQRIYALKTAPAFEAALYAGLRAGAQGDGGALDLRSIRRFCRHVGVAYQLRNDLKDWEHDGHDKLVPGQDSFAARPTLLRALAVEAAGAEAREVIETAARDNHGGDLGRLRGIYEELGVFDRAETLLRKYRGRALALADSSEPPALRELLRFIAEVVL